MKSQEFTILTKIDDGTNPYYTYAKTLTKHLLNAYGYDGHSRICHIGYEANHELVHIWRGLTHQFRYGFDYIDHIVVKGFVDVDAKLWEDHFELMGYKAIWALVLHEFAHAMQVDRGQGQGNPHNSHWAKAVKDLQILYPYEEVKEL